MTAVTKNQHTPLPGLLNDVIAMTRRNLLRLCRTPQVIVFATIQPVIFVLLFNFVFGGSIDFAEGVNYIDFLVPGILVQTSLFAAGNTAIGLTDDLQKGAIDRFRSLPMHHSAVLIGRTNADALRAALTMTIITVVGFLVGFRTDHYGGLILGVLLAIALAYAFNWVFATFALYVKDPEAAQAGAFLPVFPLVFAASTFAPVQNMPGWLQPFANNQPVTVTVDAIRALTQGMPPGRDAVMSLGYSVAILVVFIPLASRKFRKG
ncbi:MAG: ABC transporter permease [Acidimicrobiales bacterium]|nr:ABC transporter permease [Acidimicrobiales bacterium]